MNYSTELAVAYGNAFKLEGAITRLANGNVQANMKIYPKYSLKISNIYFGLYYTTDSKLAASGSSSGTNWTMNSGWHKLFFKKSPGEINNYDSQGTNGNNGYQLNWKMDLYPTTEYTVADADKDKTLYFAVCFSAPSYFHVINGVWVTNAGDSTKVSGSLAPAYKAPSNLSISSSEITETSFKISASWTKGTNSDGRAYITANSETKLIDNDPVVFTGLTPNTSYSVKGRLADATHANADYGSQTISVLTLISTPTSWTSATSTTNSVTLGATSVNGGNFKYQYRIQKAGVWSAWQDSGTFSGLSNNTKYPVESRCMNTDNNTTSGSLAGEVWTYPVISALNLSLKSGSEHNTINATSGTTVSSGTDQYLFKIDTTAGTWSSSSSASWGSLAGNSTHTITVKTKNITSGLESAEVSKSITTWYNPLTNLVIILVNRWFWYLQIKCTFDYQGGASNITKYEFAIGDDQTLQNKGTTNLHSRGTTDPSNSNKLNYNTNYNCQVRVTDNHGRTYAVNDIVFRTLDERPLYVDGTLREVKVIKPDGTTHYVTPNLLNVVQSDGSVINMNKIINNDNRTDFS